MSLAKTNLEGMVGTRCEACCVGTKVEIMQGKSSDESQLLLTRKSFEIQN